MFHGSNSSMRLIEWSAVGQGIESIVRAATPSARPHYAAEGSLFEASFPLAARVDAVRSWGQVFRGRTWPSARRGEHRKSSADQKTPDLTSNLLGLPCVGFPALTHSATH